MAPPPAVAPLRHAACCLPHGLLRPFYLIFPQKKQPLQVDQIFYSAALAANQARLPLAKMAVAETRMGVVEDKVIKVC